MPSSRGVSGRPVVILRMNGRTAAAVRRRRVDGRAYQAGRLKRTVNQRLSSDSLRSLPMKKPISSRRSATTRVPLPPSPPTTTGGSKVTAVGVDRRSPRRSAITRPGCRPPGVGFTRRSATDVAAQPADRACPGDAGFLKPGADRRGRSADISADVARKAELAIHRPRVAHDQTLRGQARHAVDANVRSIPPRAGVREPERRAARQRARADCAGRTGPWRLAACRKQAHDHAEQPRRALTT